MFKTAIPFFIRAITPVHAGSGNDLGIVDLPIQREKHTGFPKIEASTLKGSIRDAFEIEANGDEKEETKIHLIFGYDETNSSDDVKNFFKETLDFTQFSSAIAFADARILLFPIKSLKGVFAYATCPAVLKRLKEDLKMALKEDEIKVKIKNNNQEEEKEFRAEFYQVKDKALVSGNNESKLLVQENGNQVVLEEYLFEVEKKQEVSELAQILSALTGIDENFLKERLIILDDDDFTDFVKLSTEVITRIKINNETGTVDTGALFTEEYLPTETVMYSIVFFSPLFVPEDKKEAIKEKLGNDFNFSEETAKTFFKNVPETLQIGGNETIGKGFIEVNLFDSEEENKNDH